MDSIVAPSWVDVTKIKSDKRVKIHEITTANGKAGYTVKTDDFGWFVVFKKDNETTPPAVTPVVPVLYTQAFYTSNDNEFLVVMKDENTVDVAESKKLLQALLSDITNEDDKKLAEDFIANATESDAQILTIEGQKKLFVKVNEHTTKVFHATKNTSLKNAFKHTNAVKGVPENVNLDEAVAPSWVMDKDKVVYYNTDAILGYTLLSEQGHWFYAPKKATPFYTSNQMEFPVILKDEKTVDFNATKEILMKLMDSIVNLQDKELAEEFVRNGTEDNVQILEIEGEVLLFVQSDPATTKVFHKNKNSHLLGKFGNKKPGYKLGSPVDLDISNAIFPKWANIDEEITHHHLTNSGYTLLNKTGHWFYTPKQQAFTVDFYTGTNSVIPSIEVFSGSLITGVVDPIRDGYEFDGWYKD